MNAISATVLAIVVSFSPLALLPVAMDHHAPIAIVNDQHITGVVK